MIIISEQIILAIIIVIFVILLFAGMNIGTLLLFIGIFGVFVLDGMNAVTGVLYSDTFSSVATYSLTTVPMFILMSQFILRSDMIKELYSVIYILSRGKKEMLGILTVVFGGLLGSVSGSGTATSAALGQVVTPELEKRGVNRNMAGATSALAGSLSGIIPPSIILILYGSVTQTPIGTMFFAAMIPGVIATLVICAGVYIGIKKSSLVEKVNETDKSVENEKIVISRSVIVLSMGVVIAISVFGGIYLGVFTPTEAGAVGATIALIAALLLGKVNLKFINKSLMDTLNITAMVLFIMIGAQIFSRFISLSQIARKLIDLLDTLIAYPFIILILLMVLYFFLFMFIEGAAVIGMAVPLSLPIVYAADIDIVMFGVLITLLGTLGLLTPPVGLSVFAVSGSSKIPSEKMFKITFRFTIVVALVVGGLLILFPQLATWLPNKM